MCVLFLYLLVVLFIHVTRTATFSRSLISVSPQVLENAKTPLMFSHHVFDVLLPPAGLTPAEKLAVIRHALADKMRGPGAPHATKGGADGFVELGEGHGGQRTTSSLWRPVTATADGFVTVPFAVNHTGASGRGESSMLGLKEVNRRLGLVLYDADSRSAATFRQDKEAAQRRRQETSSRDHVIGPGEDGTSYRGESSFPHAAGPASISQLDTPSSSFASLSAFRSLIWPIVLDPGMHTLLVRLAPPPTMASDGGPPARFHCSFLPPAAPLPFSSIQVDSGAAEMASGERMAAGGEEGLRVPTPGDSDPNWKADHSWRPGEVHHMPDIVDGVLPTPLASIPIVNPTSSPVTDFKVEFHTPRAVLRRHHSVPDTEHPGKTKDESSLEAKPIHDQTPILQDPSRPLLSATWLPALKSDKDRWTAPVLPGQSFPLYMQLTWNGVKPRRLEAADMAAGDGSATDKGICSGALYGEKDDPEVIEIDARITGNFRDSVSRPAAEHTVVLRCRSFARRDPYIFTYRDVDGAVEYAAVRPPKRRCRKGLQHQAALSDTLLSPTGPLLKGQFGFDWEGAGLANAVTAIHAFQHLMPGVPDPLREEYVPDTSRLVITGHSMGGHGCLVFSTHFADHVVGSMCGAAWIKMSTYSGGYSPAGQQDGQADKRTRLMSSGDSEYATDFAAVHLVGMPFMGRCGEKDDNVPPEHLRRFTHVLSNSNFAELEPTAVLSMMLDNSTMMQSFLEISRQPSLLQYYTDLKGNLDRQIPLIYSLKAGESHWFGDWGGIILMQPHTWGHDALVDAVFHKGQGGTMSYAVGQKFADWQQRDSSDTGASSDHRMSDDGRPPPPFFPKVDVCICGDCTRHSNNDNGDGWANVTVAGESDGDQDAQENAEWHICLRTHNVRRLGLKQYFPALVRTQRHSDADGRTSADKTNGTLVLYKDERGGKPTLPAQTQQRQGKSGGDLLSSFRVHLLIDGQSVAHGVPTDQLGRFTLPSHHLCCTRKPQGGSQCLWRLCGGME
ncbi:unnamed protein product [Vitrella brassicaformis CCMP3155]|uniref:Peptidase S9 prolyl oligopeptidase catalytic domain-containing protein n=2 Tax=Vitrella brassicaformis TaxID=1169539 RepID=A0A0G4H7G1_VITBC|nr:unnamed protein product [Vitrella brassicaformis CCMP3155]|eukprot:CEM39686.1 unnamed protein product [Vitrella brassicaformis CCMP3155]